MEQGKINIPKYIGIIFIYILLSAIGIFGEVEMILFPILALPLAVYMIKSKPTLRMQVIFHVIMLIGNYVFTSSIISVLIYIAAILIPTYVILFFDKQDMTLPVWIMYVGIFLAVSAFIFLTGLKRLGIDFETVFTDGLTKMNELTEKAVDLSIQMQRESGQLDEKTFMQLTEGKKYLQDTIEAMKAFYGYFVVSQIVMGSAITVIILNTILRRHDKTRPSIKQLLQFRLSKMAVALFFVSLLLIDLSGEGNGAVALLGQSLMNFFVGLFTIAGGLGLLGLINKSSLKGALRAFAYIGAISLWGLCPQLLVIFGCLDAVFNYRKVKIVV